MATNIFDTLEGLIQPQSLTEQQVFQQNLANEEANLGHPTSGLLQINANIVASIATIESPHKVTIPLNNPFREILFPPLIQPSPEQQYLNTFTYTKTNLETSLGKVTTSATGEKYSDFVGNVCEILCVAEYIVNDQLIGCLVIWQIPQNATHFEIFKKNVFSPAGTSTGYERILFLDIASVNTETANFSSYVSSYLGLNFNTNIGIYLDTNLSDDRIYQYKILGTLMPKVSDDIQYSTLFGSKKLLTEVSLAASDNSTTFQLASVTMGSENLAWLIALLNQQLGFFGRQNYETPINQIGLSRIQALIERDFHNETPRVYIPTNVNNVLQVIQESTSLFGLKNTFQTLITQLGGLPSQFATSFLDSIDETSQTFSYTKFKQDIVAKVSTFAIVLELTSLSQQTNVASSVSTANLQSALNTKDSVYLPTQTGTVDLITIDGITSCLSFVNDCLLLALFTQDQNNFNQVKTLVQNILSSQGNSSLLAQQQTEQQIVANSSGEFGFHITPQFK